MFRLFVKSNQKKMTKNKIDILREKINDLDDKILNYLDERSRIVKEIGKFKDQSRSVIDINLIVAIYSVS